MVEAPALKTCTAFVRLNPRWAIRQLSAATFVGILVLIGLWHWVQTTRPVAPPLLIGAQITSTDSDGGAMLMTTWAAPALHGCVRQGIHLLARETRADERPAYYTLDSTLNGDHFSAAGFVFDLYESVPAGLRDGRWTFIYRIYYGCGPFYLIPWAEVIAPLTVRVDGGRVVGVDVR